jgi:ABC-type uncharacterized transport system involved in gliding motility auxiliary subunit
VALMELKARHAYGLGAIVIGLAAIVVGAISWFINSKIDTTVQAAFALGLIGIALSAALEINLLTQALRSRQARYGAETLVMVVAFLGVVGLLNFILTRDQFKKRWDWTETKENTLAPETIKMLSELGEPVKVIGFFSSDGQSFAREDAEKLLADYRLNSGGKLSYEFVDPFLRPALAQDYGITRDGTLVAVRGDQHELADFADESSLTNAIVRLNNPEIQVVYFISGHGEKSIDDNGDGGFSQLKSLLEGINYQLKTLDVITDPLPADTSAIVIAGPTSPYSAAEVEVIGKYLAGGGKAVILAEPSLLMGIEAGQTDALADYLSQNWGITLRDDFVIDPVQYLQGADPSVPITLSYGFSPITQDLERTASFFPSARSLAVADTGAAPAGVTVSSIINTGPDAWGETNFDSLNTGEWAPEEDDAQGALSLAATAENTASGGRVVVFGDSEFGANAFWRTGAANGFLLLNAVKWSTAEEDLISLTPRSTVSRSMNVFSRQDQIIIFLLSCILPPFLVIVGAVGLWWSRRKNA